MDGRDYYQLFRLRVLRPILRNKCQTLTVILIICALVFTVRVWISKHGSHPWDAVQDDDRWEEVYDDVFKRWYNVSREDAWYNGKMINKLDGRWDRYIDHVRRHWIDYSYDPYKPYTLSEPKLKDPSAGQADVIRRIFSDEKYGFFVECGAYDGETRSNTLVLERFLGWTGLLIEADPINFSKMVRKNRRAYLSPSCLAVHPYPSVTTFLMADNVGRLHHPTDKDADLPNSPDVAHSGRHIVVQCIPFAHLMAALNVTTVDYFSLDIEGSELDVLKTIPFDEINIRTLSVEFSHMKSEAGALDWFMESKGYEVATTVTRKDRLANDVIYIKREGRRGRSHI